MVRIGAGGNAAIKQKQKAEQRQKEEVARQKAI